MIVGAEDVTYVEYFHRGIKELPEEAPAVVEWMDDSAPRTDSQEV